MVHRKFVYLLFSGIFILLLFSLVACGDDSDDSGAEKAAATAMATSTPEPQVGTAEAEAIIRAIYTGDKAGANAYLCDAFQVDDSIIRWATQYRFKSVACTETESEIISCNFTVAYMGYSMAEGKEVEVATISDTWVYAIEDGKLCGGIAPAGTEDSGSEAISTEESSTAPDEVAEASPEPTEPPDRDSDGILDSNDACPDEAGLEAFAGCPDTDEDGIPDNEDACPDDSGLEASEGCPDTDGDGLSDNEDACPDVAEELPLYRGCKPEFITPDNASQVSILTRFESQGESVTAIEFSPDGTMLAALSMDGTISFWDVKTGELITTIKAHEEWAFNMAFSSDGKLLATTGNDNTARIWDVETGESVAVMEGHTEYTRAVAFSPDNKYLATSGHDKTTRIWDVETGEELKLFEFPSWDFIFLPDGKLILSTSDNLIQTWDWENDEPLNSFPVTGATAIALHPDGERLVAASIDGPIGVYDITTGEEISELISPDSFTETYRLVFSPDGTLLASIDMDNLHLWSMEDYTELAMIDVGHNEKGLAFSPDGTLIAASSFDRVALLMVMPAEE